MKSLLHLILVSISCSVYGQTKMPCEILKQICGNEKIQKSFKLDQSATPLILVTDSAEFSSCGGVDFGTHKASIIHNDSILMRGHLYSKFWDNCSYYPVWHVRKKSSKYYLFQITQLCSNLECEVTIRKIGNSYQVLKVDTYVL